MVQQVGAESTIEAFLIQNGCIGMCSSTSESSSSSSGKRFGSAFGSGLGLTTSVSWSSSNRGGMASSGGLFGHPSSSSSNRRKNGGGGSTSKHSSCISGNAGGWQWWVRVAFKMHNGSSSSCCTSYQAATESNTSSASVRDSQSSLNGAAVGEYWWDLMFTSMTGVNDFLEHIQALRGVKPDEDELGEMLQVDRIVHHGDIIASTPGAAQIEMEVAEVVAASSAVAIGGSITMEERQDPLEHPFDASPFAQNRKKDGVKFIIGDD